MKQSERFLNAFIAIEMQLKELLKINHLPFTQLVSKASKLNDVVAYYEFDLIEYSQLRNAITHNRVGSGDEVIAEPHMQVVEAIEQIAQALSKPKLILDSFNKKVFYANIDDDLQNIMKQKREHSYSMVPIYRDKQYIGVIHDLMLARFMEDHFANPTTHDLSVSDLLTYKNKKERVVFVSKACTVFEALRIFTQRHQDGHRITAIIVTEDGRMNQLPLQILTVADIPVLLHERA